MKKLWLTFGLAFTLSTSIYAQSSGMPTQEVWYNADVEATGIYGVNTEKAWQFLKENNRKPTSLVVAVIDSGVQADHEDLQANMWTNPKEKLNGKDDDKNGYIDDIHGWNFIGGKDGKNVDGDTLEKVRIYKYVYLPLFEGSDATQNEANKKKFPTEFADYAEIKAEIPKELKEAAENHQQYTMLKSMIEKGFPTLIKEFGNQPVTPETLSKYEPTEETMVGMQMFAFLPQEYWDGKTMQEINDKLLEEMTGGIEHFANVSKYHYNVDFESRGIVGDDYANKKEIGYGNNDVEGPDAGHGTHVAGVIAAVRGNGIGIDGIAGNDVKIMSLRTVPNGDERDKDVANAIRYAADNGAKIMNWSFGKSHSPEKDLVWEAIRYAESKGILMVKAAGNDGENIDEVIHYPSNFDDKGNIVSNTLITVGASTPDAESLVASFSNYGIKSVDVFSPGTEILSTVPKNKYKEEQGTSMASPIVAGVAALVWSHYPDLTAGQVKEIILKSVNTNPQLKDKSVTGGVVDAYKAVQLAEQMSAGKSNKKNKKK